LKKTIFSVVENYMYLDISREKSRKERYEGKRQQALSLPAALAAISFDFDDNVAFLIRSAVCFGIRDVFIIGKLPSRGSINSKTGSLYDYISIKSFSNTSEFSKYAKDNGYKIVAIEICENAESLHDYKFAFDEKTILLLGNESTGVPGDLIIRNDAVYIPMPGLGYCLNVSQAGTIVMNEYYRQYAEFTKKVSSYKKT